MIFYFIRHGDPIYNPNSLTSLGLEQANALSKRLALCGLDEIYCSPSNRAVQTAMPTCKLINKQMTLLEWADEDLAWQEFMVEIDVKCNWVFQCDEYVDLFRDKELTLLGNKWYNHKKFVGTKIKSGIERINREVDDFFLSLGFEHDRKKARYKVVTPCNKRVALFAHAGFGLAFLSSVLDIPYYEFCTRFDFGHSSYTVINFSENKEYSYPKILQLSNDSHLYKEGILTPYQNKIKI